MKSNFPLFSAAAASFPPFPLFDFEAVLLPLFFAPPRKRLAMQQLPFPFPPEDEEDVAASVFSSSSSRVKSGMFSTATFPQSLDRVERQKSLLRKFCKKFVQFYRVGQKDMHSTVKSRKCVHKIEI